MSSPAISKPLNYDYLAEKYQYNPADPEAFTPSLLGDPLDAAQTKTKDEMSLGMIREGFPIQLRMSTARAVSELALRLKFAQVCLVNPPDVNNLPKPQQLLAPLHNSTVFLRKATSILACVIIHDIHSDTGRKTVQQYAVCVITFTGTQVMCTRARGFEVITRDSHEMANMMRRHHVLKLMDQARLSPPNYCILKSAHGYINIEEEMDTCLQTFSGPLLDLPAENKKSICLQLVNCVLFLHEQNIIHRDVKFENFLLKRTSQGEKIYLIDHEFCSYLDDPSGLETPAGSLAYTPPEIILRYLFKQKDGPSVSKALDIWALGIMFDYIYWGGEGHKLFRILDEIKLMSERKIPIDRKLQEWKQEIEALPPAPVALETLGDFSTAMLQPEPEDRLPLREVYSRLHATPASRLFAKSQRPAPVARKPQPNKAPLQPVSPVAKESPQPVRREHQETSRRPATENSETKPLMDKAQKDPGGGILCREMCAIS